MKELICIVCPNGCHLKVDEENGYNVTGNKCERGAEYGKAELLHPVRMVTSTVRVEGCGVRRLPVKTSAAVDKGRVFDVMALLDGVCVHAPVHAGDVIVPHIFGTDVDIITCKSI